MNGSRAVERLACGLTAARFLRWSDSKERLSEIKSLTDHASDDLGISEPAAFDVVIAGYVQELRNLSYRDYLATLHWQMVRTCALELADYRCQICNSPQSLQVHHRSYDGRGSEEPQDVVVLCGGCHQLFHENRRLAAQ